MFNGATITFSEQARRAKPTKPIEEKTSLSFAPRAARRGGKVIGKARPVAKAAEPAPPKPAGDQDFYRNLVATTNEKRKAEGESEADSKRQKV